MVDCYKPFACSESGCSQSFASEDHLFVHGITHHSHLSSITMPSFSGDQTPTPTKFLRSCDELGLFQEFTRNPFDEEFRKSVDQSSSEVIGKENVIDVASPVCEDSSSVSAVVSQDSNSHPNVSLQNTVHFNETSASSALVHFSETSDSSALVQLVIQGLGSNSASLGHLLIPMTIKLPDGQTITVEVPASVSIPNVLSLLNFVPADASTQSASVAATTAVPFPSAFVDATQLGNLATVGPAPGSTIFSKLNKRVTKGSALTASTASAITETTRQKLKAAVQSMQQRATGATDASANKIKTAVPPTSLPPPGKIAIPAHSLSFPTSIVTSFDSNVQLRAADTSTPRQKPPHAESAIPCDNDGSDRRKMLERQRMAANRCRQKKKQWISNLETKTQKMETQNERLLAEIYLLKDEAKQIKEFLLDHQECPESLTP